MAEDTLLGPGDPGGPGFELPGFQAQTKREAEQRAIAEVQAFESEKRFVNRQVAENIAVLGQSDIASHPIEISDSGRKA